MLKFHKVAAQGEITISRLGDASMAKHPKNANRYEQEDGQFIIGHSESGHSHVLEHSRGATVTVLADAPPGMKILHMILTEANALVHKRDHDTHETIALEPGEYDVRIAREFDHYEELARQSAD